MVRRRLPHDPAGLCKMVTVNETSAPGLPRLGGVGEIADLLGISRSGVSNLADRRATSGFPEPVKILKMGPLYNLDEIEEWAHHRITR